MWRSQQNMYDFINKNHTFSERNTRQTLPSMVGKGAECALVGMGYDEQPILVFTASVKTEPVTPPRDLQANGKRLVGAA